jgi:maltose O-acetyltransferase
MDEKAKMLAGELYNPFTPQLTAKTLRAQRILHIYNHLPPDSAEKESLLRELLGKIGDKTTIRAPFYCDYGSNIELGDRVFVNFNCVFLDCAPITVGNNVLFGPSVQLYTATHPLDAETRSRDLEYALPICIEDHVWVGGGAIILPGLTIGKGSVIGAGSVVTKDVLPKTVVAGNPAKIIRHL